MSSCTSEEYRAGFIALRDELEARHADLDLVEVWASMSSGERQTVLRSAALVAANDSRNRRSDLISMPVLEMPAEDRLAIRSAIQRMSAFASGLKDRCHKHSAPCHVALAQQARAALDQGDIATARHFISLIETAS